MRLSESDKAIARRLGGILRTRRKELGLTLEYVAGRARIDLSQLSKVERGAEGTSDGTKARIARALKLVPAEVMARAFGRSAA